jgi:hypothetical protein
VMPPFRQAQECRQRSKSIMRPLSAHYLAININGRICEGENFGDQCRATEMKNSACR